MFTSKALTATMLLNKCSVILAEVFALQTRGTTLKVVDIVFDLPTLMIPFPVMFTSACFFAVYAAVEQDLFCFLLHD